MVRLRLDGVYYTLPHGRSRLWRWSLFLPVMVALSAFAVGLVSHWLARSHLHREMLIGQLGPHGPGLAKEQFYQSTQADMERALFTPEVPAESHLEDVHLIMSEDDLEAIVRLEQVHTYDLKPPRERYRAFVKRGGGQFLECRVSTRGISEWHHRVDQLSFRLRFSKQGPSPGYRWIELQRLEDVVGMANWYPDRLGTELGVMNARAQHVRLFLNRKYLGVYSVNYRAGDNLALANGVLPGIFFKGDRLDLPRLWTTPADWAISGDVTEAVTLWFGEFLKVVGEGKAETKTRLALSKYLDEESYARWSAIATFVASSHTDDHHNQMFYLSTYEGKLKPILWDFNSLGIILPVEAKMTIISNHLAGLALQDPRWVYERDKTLYRLVHEERWLKLLVGSMEKLQPHLEAGRGLVQLENVVPFSPDWDDWPDEMKARIYPVEYSGRAVAKQIKAKTAWLKSRRKFVKAYLEDAQVSLRKVPAGTEIAVQGSVAVKVVGKTGRTYLLYPGLAFAGKDESLPSPHPYLKPAPLFYQLDEAPTDLRFENAFTGRSVEPNPAFPKRDPRQVSLDLEPVEVDPLSGDMVPRMETLKLGPGEVVLTQDVTIPEGTHLIVRPGTELKIASGKSLFVRGKVSMEGTKEEPIQISAQGPEPFGCVGLVGKGTAGSSFRFVSVSGGSLGEFDAVQFKGMFNVYSCPEVTLRDCRFFGNQIGDDIVNLALSNIDVRDCEFFQAPMDGLDLDACRGEISGCLFHHCGNDGLDIMQTTLTVRNCKFQNCGDKGVSIGENCATVLEGCEARDCATGLEFKDASRTIVKDSTLVSCETGARAYRKKWLYVSGGYAQLSATKFEDCRRDLAIDQHSRIWLENSEPRIPAGLAHRVERTGAFGLGPGPLVLPPGL